MTSLYHFLAEHCHDAAAEVRELYVEVVGERLKNAIGRCG